MRAPSRFDYAYAVGRVRVLERYLVEKAVFRQAAEADDFPSAMKVIYDAGHFSEELNEITSSAELDRYFEKEESQLYRLLSEILLEEKILQVFLADNLPDRALAMCQEMNYEFIINYLRHKIDLGNLKMFCRMKYSALPKEKLLSHILRGGFLEEGTFLANYDLSFSDFGMKIQASPYYKIYEKAMSSLEEKETFVDLERDIEDFLMLFLRRAKQIAFGPEPVYAYGLAKKRELNLLRIVGMGKMKRIPSEMLKERISETYV